MAKAYSEDLRERVIEAVEAGASRRAAAERFKIGVSSAIRWVGRWRNCGSVAAKPSGGSRSALGDHAEVLLGLIAAQPDLTLDEMCRLLVGRGAAHGGVAVLRPARDQLQKKRARRGAGSRRRGPGPGGVEAKPATA